MKQKLRYILERKEYELMKEFYNPFNMTLNQ